MAINSGLRITQAKKNYPDNKICIAQTQTKCCNALVSSFQNLR